MSGIRFLPPNKIDRRSLCLSVYISPARIDRSVPYTHPHALFLRRHVSLQARFSKTGRADEDRAKTFLLSEENMEWNAFAARNASKKREKRIS